MEVEDHVMGQNQVGNQPTRWNKRGKAMEVLPHRQYKVMVEENRRITLRNLKFLRKFIPVIGDPNYKLNIPQTSHKRNQHSQPQLPHMHQHPHQEYQHHPLSGQLVRVHYCLWNQLLSQRQVQDHLPSQPHRLSSMAGTPTSHCPLALPMQWNSGGLLGVGNPKSNTSTKWKLTTSLLGFYPFATLTSVLHLTDSHQSN